MHFDNKVVVRTDIPTQRVASYTIQYCDQTAGWMKTPLIGTEVDLRAGHIVLDGFPALCERGTAPPPFSPMSIVATVAHLSYCSSSCILYVSLYISASLFRIIGCVALHQFTVNY